MIAFKRGNSLFYVVPDHLGGTLSVRDGQGNEVGSVRYNAFGSDRSSSGTLNTDKRFTGETLDSSSGPYRPGARFYDPRRGPTASSSWRWNRLDRPLHGRRISRIGESDRGPQERHSDRALRWKRRG